MKPINKQAQKTFDKLTADLAPGESRKVANSESFMAVSVDCLQRVPLGDVFSVSHYYEQNGDLMADPDMTFLKATLDGRVYPLTFRQDGGIPFNQEAATLVDGGTSFRFRPRMQRDIATFAGQWMANIKQQQY